MKILVDNKIPYIQEAIQCISHDVEYLSAKDFTPEKVKYADVLIIRTRTKCTAELLEGSQVKFIATATIGFDHIDVEYCAKNGIIWKNAPGCNANSVRQYIESVLILLKQDILGSLEGKTMAVIGVGHVGTKIVDLAQSYGMHVLTNDPIRAINEPDFIHTSLDIIAKQADIISFHVPLTKQGEYPTLHLANSDFFCQLQRKPIIINTSRGEVIDTVSIKHALFSNLISKIVLDVWENEPNIDTDLLQSAYLGTSHIAGYSADGKAKATEMSLQSISDFYKLNQVLSIVPPSPKEAIIVSNSKEDALLKIYDPRVDSQILKGGSDKFEYNRSHYALRRESLAYDIRVIE